MNPSKFAVAVALAAILLLDGTAARAPTVQSVPKPRGLQVKPTSVPTRRPKASKSPKPTTAPKSSKTGSPINTITSAQLASIQQENKSILSFLIAGTVIAAAAALLNIALKWAQKSRQARSINDLEEEEEAVDGFEDEFEDESNEQLRDVIVGEGVEIVETH
ncbi:hypothetical protein ACHAWC_010360 [Mediolabrus comicus]